MKLSKRLQAIADLIPPDAAVADIGTDHGHLPVYLALKGFSRKIIASDISDGSLAAARRSAEEADVTESIIFVTAPGLDAVEPSDANTVIIAGLGAETIVNILKDAPWTKQQRVTLILQPQSKIDILFRFLYDNLYNIKKTISVLDRGKHYTAILAVGGEES